VNPEILTFVNKFIHLDEVDSTNLEAKRLAKKAPAANFVVIAERQTAGKGRGGNVWWSGRDSLSFTLSLKMRPEINIIEIPLVIGLSVRSVLQSLLDQASVHVKWPNDIMANAKKICGILCESVHDVDGNERVFIGVGINVNDSIEAAAPESIKGLSTSTYDILGKKLDKNSLLADLLMEFKKRLDELSSFGFSHFMKDWEKHDYMKDRFVEVVYPEHVVRGRVLGISKSGFLCILSENKTVEIMSGTVNLIYT